MLTAWHCWVVTRNGIRHAKKSNLVAITNFLEELWGESANPREPEKCQMKWPCVFVAYSYQRQLLRAGGHYGCWLCMYLLHIHIRDSCCMLVAIMAVGCVCICCIFISETVAACWWPLWLLAVYVSVAYSYQRQLLCADGHYGCWLCMYLLHINIRDSCCVLMAIMAVDCVCICCIFISETVAACWWPLCTCSSQPLFLCIEIQCLDRAESAWTCCICWPVPEVCALCWSSWVHFTALLSISITVIILTQSQGLTHWRVLTTTRPTTLWK